MLSCKKPWMEKPRPLKAQPRSGSRSRRALRKAQTSLSQRFFGFFSPLYIKLPLRKSCLGSEFNVIILEKSACVGKDPLTYPGLSLLGRQKPPPAASPQELQGPAVTLRCHRRGDAFPSRVALPGDPSPQGMATTSHPGLGPIPPPACQRSWHKEGSRGAGGGSLPGVFLPGWRGWDKEGTCVGSASRLLGCPACPLPPSPPPGLPAPCPSS